jgi:hypothetical protein
MAPVHVEPASHRRKAMAVSWRRRKVAARGGGDQRPVHTDGVEGVEVVEFDCHGGQGVVAGSQAWACYLSVCLYEFIYVCMHACMHVCMIRSVTHYFIANFRAYQPRYFRNVGVLLNIFAERYEYLKIIIEF